MHTIILVDACLPPLREVVHGSSVDVLSVREKTSGLSERTKDTRIGQWAIERARQGIQVVILTRDTGFKEQIDQLDQSELRAPIHILSLGANFGRALRRQLIEKMVDRLRRLEEGMRQAGVRLEFSLVA